MTINTDRGFTIIEVILFLAISGMLFAALLLGVGSTISGQRYIDSVRSIKALFEYQYTASINIQNTANAGCGGVDRGQSQNCIILGRLVHIKPGGKTVQISSVIAREENTYAAGRSPYESGISDNDSFNRTLPWILGADTQDTTLEWGASLTNTGAGSFASEEYIYILRSPTSGLMRVYYNRSNPIDNGTGGVPTSNSVLKKCIVNDSGNQPKQLIIIDPSSTSANFVKTEIASRTDCP